MSDTPLRWAILGASRRAFEYFVPILTALPDAEIVGAWSRSTPSARKLADAGGAPAFTNLDELVEKTKPDAAVVCVHSSANGVIGEQAAERNMHLLLEPPIAFDLREADAIIAWAKANNLKLEVAEQFHRRPPEQLKLAAIEADLFGTIHYAINDLEGHGYHGISVIRSYIGLNHRPVRVRGATARYPVVDRSGEQVDEHVEHGVIEFKNGAIGIHHWSSVAYDSPVRGGLGGRLYGERGCWETTRVDGKVFHSVRIAGIDGPGITIERDEAGGILEAIRGTEHVGQRRTIEWTNPLFQVQKSMGIAWSDDEIAVACCVKSLADAIRNNTEPSYGPWQARLDQQLTAAIWDSSKQGGKAIEIELPADFASRRG